jgi:mono/diheme cytochrome c family protein
MSFLETGLSHGRQGRKEDCENSSIASLAPLVPGLFFRLAAISMIALSALSAVQAADYDGSQARVDYILHCQGCHLPDGAGSPGAVPRMKDFLGWYLHIPGGREYIVQVPGAANAPISDAALAEVMNWVLREFSAAQLPADFAPYTGAEISRLRRGASVDVHEARYGLLRRMQTELGVAEYAPGQVAD